MSRPKSYTEPRVNMALRLPPGLHARLKSEASDRDVLVNWLITRAVERYLAALYPEAGK